jgi:replication-associated recombination protein RarA
VARIGAILGPGLDPALTVPRDPPVLLDRRSECEELDRLIADLRTGQSRAMVIWGDGGIGKTALLNRTLRQAADCRAIRTAGVEAERELALAALIRCVCRCSPSWRFIGLIVVSLVLAEALIRTDECVCG